MTSPQQGIVKCILAESALQTMQGLYLKADIHSCCFCVLQILCLYEESCLKFTFRLMLTQYIIQVVLQLHSQCLNTDRRLLLRT